MATVGECHVDVVIVAEGGDEYGIENVGDTVEEDFGLDGGAVFLGEDLDVVGGVVAYFAGVHVSVADRFAVGAVAVSGGGRCGAAEVGVAIGSGGVVLADDTAADCVEGVDGVDVTAALDAACLSLCSIACLRVWSCL